MGGPSPGFPTETMDAIFLDADPNIGLGSRDNAALGLHGGDGADGFDTAMTTDTDSDQSCIQAFTPTSSTSNFNFPSEEFHGAHNESEPMWPPVDMNNHDTNTAYTFGPVGSPFGVPLVFDQPSPPLLLIPEPKSASNTTSDISVHDIQPWGANGAFGGFPRWAPDPMAHKGSFSVVAPDIVSVPSFPEPKEPRRPHAPYRGRPGAYIMAKPPSDSHSPVLCSAHGAPPASQGNSEQLGCRGPSPSFSSSPITAASPSFPQLPTPTRDSWTKDQERFLLECKRRGSTFPEISVAMLESFGVKRNPNVLSKRHRNIIDRGDNTVSAPWNADDRNQS